MSFRIDDILKNRSTEHLEIDSKTNTADKKIFDDVYSLTDKESHEDFLRNRSACGDTWEKIYLPSEIWYNYYKPISHQYYGYGDNVYMSPHFPRSKMWPVYHNLTRSYPMNYHHPLSKRKGGQVRFTSSQTDLLEKRFTSHKYLSPEDRKVLADTLKLSDRQVKTWFQNRRAKWRRNTSCSSTSTASQDNQKISSEDDFCDSSVFSPETQK